MTTLTRTRANRAPAGVHLGARERWHHPSRLYSPPMDERPVQREPAGQDPGDVTMLLRSVASGEAQGMDRLLEAIYDDLRRLAAAHLREERADHTFQPTALVNEAYLRLVSQHSAQWNDRKHFFAFASQVLRRILIDHARARNAEKRGGGGVRVQLEPESIGGEGREIDLVELDDALVELAKVSERQAKVVEMRFFGGCTLEEIAEVLGVGRRTVDRDWTAAKAWLFVRLAAQAD